MTTTTAPLAASGKTQHLAILMVLFCWFALIAGLSLNQAFVPPPGELPLNILLSLVISISLFFVAYSRLAVFRTYVLNLDMRLLILLHSWRMLGLGFVMLYSVEQLPALFAFLAGFGDALTAIGAVILAYIMFKQSTAVSRKWVWRWNTFGLVDFVIAVGIGILTRNDALLATTNGVNSDLMTIFPFAVIPGFLVQVFIMTHIIIYLQLRTHYAQQATIKIQ